MFLSQRNVLSNLTQEHAEPLSSDRTPLPGGVSHAAPQHYDEARQHLQCGRLCVWPGPPSRLYRHHSGEEEVYEGRHHVAAVWVAAAAGLLQAQFGSANRYSCHRQKVLLPVTGEFGGFKWKVSTLACSSLRKQGNFPPHKNANPVKCHFIILFLFKMNRLLN